MENADYKNTLNLPKTAFAMKANLPEREPLILAHWQSIDLYAQLRQLGKDRPRFVLHDGPPYANGRPHLGTALNKILKDIIVKSKTLSGFDAPFVPGWDCHGLPIELNVEKKQGKPGVKLSAKAFRQACRAYAAEQVAWQKEHFQRLGVVADWERPYLTMDFRYEADAIRALGKMIANGHLQRGEKPVYWCIDCGSSLAEAEVEYRDKSSPSVYVRFDVLDPQSIYSRFNLSPEVIKKCEQLEGQISMPIWTTTPWTLPANQAVCVNPELVYVLVCVDQPEPTSSARYFVLAEGLLAKVAEALGWQAYSVLAQCHGRELEHCKLQHPLLNRHVPVILGDHVSLEQGTGNVHTAPAHGQDDYRVGMVYGLPVDNPVDNRSCFHPDIPLVGGLHVTKANEPIMVALADSGKLLHHAVLQHSYPHCWRHKTPLIFRATPQWFISMDKQGLRAGALAAIEKTEWIPAWGQARIQQMIETRPDWCISRQRTWGIPIPLFIHRHSLALHPKTAELIDAVAKRVEEQGIDAWFDLDPVELLGSEAEHYEKLTDTLDVWFDSGVSQYCVLQQRNDLAFPADLYLEGSDQHRGWFQTSLLASLAINQKTPFKKVLTHGYVVDGKGLKMSKSLGNVMLPSEVVSTMGADVLRLWAASTDHTNEVNVSKEILQRSADAYRRIRNTARFMLSNLDDFDPEKECLPFEELVELDRWALQYAGRLQQDILTAYERFHFQTVFQLIHNFCSIEMGSFYLDIIKDRLYTVKADVKARRSAQTTLYHLIEALVRWMAPILSFTAEEIWQHLPVSPRLSPRLSPRPASVFLSSWYAQFPAVLETEQGFWAWFMSLRDEVNKALERYRQEGRLGSALEAEVTLYVSADRLSALQRLGDELRFGLITSGAHVKPLEQAPSDALSTSLDQVRLSIKVSEAAKCVRCWHRRPDVGQASGHPGLCVRCVSNVAGEGEERQYA